MSRFRTHLLVVVASAVAGTIGASFATGTAQAIVAALVQITNTTSSPVPSLNVTDPGRIPYQSSVDNGGKCSGNSICPFSFPTVPSGHRVVVQHIGGFLNFTPPTPPISIIATISTSGLTSGISPITPQDTDITFDQPVLFYVDASNSVNVAVFLTGGQFSANGTEALTLTGYELDCTVAACAPIATQ
jgi:hypothetical protein